MISIQKSAIGSAPGVFDCMGGIADRHGALALQTQTESHATVLATESSDKNVSVSSARKGKFALLAESFKQLVSERPENKDIREWLDDNKVDDWARHALASAAYFAVEFHWQPESGLSFAISSNVPMNRGLGSSTAIQVATLRALERLSGRYFQGDRLASASSAISSQILGLQTPFSFPLTAAHGKPGCLLPIDGRDSKVGHSLELPKGITILGWTSGASQADADARESADIAASMGKAIIERASDSRIDHISTIEPSFYSLRLQPLLPKTLSGKSFVEEVRGLDRSGDRNYPIRAAFRFVVEESYRSKLAAHLLSSLVHNCKRRAAEHLGELMLQSHADCQRLGLSTPEADSFVRAVADSGPSKGLFGARLCGNSADGTVVILADRKSLKELRDLARDFNVSTSGESELVF